MKNFGLTLNLDIYLNAAEELGLSTEIILPEFGYCRVFNDSKELFIKFGSFSFMNVVTSAITKNKYFTYKVLEPAGIPIPRNNLFEIDSDSPEKTFEKIVEFVGQKYPTVIKPHDMAKGFGVFSGLENMSELKNAFEQLIKLDVTTVIVEDFIYGTNYRILMFQDNALDVVERIPAYVIGNGKDNIKTLIKTKNKHREELRIALINMDEKMNLFLKKSNLTLDSIPAEGERTVLRNNANFSDGGETKRIDLEQVHPDNLKLFSDITKQARITMTGVDLISPDITKSYKENNAMINEINGSPDIDVHYYADFKMDLTPAKKIFKAYFGI